LWWEVEACGKKDATTGRRTLLAQLPIGASIDGNSLEWAREWRTYLWTRHKKNESSDCANSHGGRADLAGIRNNGKFASTPSYGRANLEKEILEYLA
jgi:hypothetical protein